MAGGVGGVGGTSPLVTLWSDVSGPYSSAVARRLRTARYRRISDDREGLEAGVTRQTEDMDEVAARRPELDVHPHVFSDNDLSATKDYRPEFERILEMVANGELDAVLCWTSNRFLRNRRDRMRVIELFKAHNVRLIPVRGNEMDFTSADGRMMADLIFSVDAGEAERTAERVSRAARQRAEQGRHHGGRRAFGYGPVIATDHNGKPVRDFHATIPEEAAVIRGIAADVLEGVPLGAVARRLNATGVATVTKAHRETCVHNAKGRRVRVDCPCPYRAWEATTLKELMVNPRLIGMRGYQTQKTRRSTGTIAVMGPAQWPAILDVDTWEQVRAILTDAKRRTNTDQTKVRRLLAGFVYCASCGHKMTGNGVNGVRLYCQRRDGNCPAPVRIGEQFVVDLVSRAVRDRLDELELQPVETTDLAGAELATLELRRSALADRWASGQMEDDAYNDAHKALTKQIRDAQARTHTSARRRATLPVNGAAGWDDKRDDLAGRRVILTHLIDGVIIGGNGAVLGDDLWRVRIVWRDLNDPR
ncbi:recombinase family protein [Frankia sp. AgB1.8]|uniref:recombinase family protein n=1 Tax=Frankia sp. AgB1.8 TaxID=2792839 RepID=UPI0027DE3925|nr:recombinase family protein [Frankia sp. AgB1.8]